MLQGRKPMGQKAPEWHFGQTLRKPSCHSVEAQLAQLLVGRIRAHREVVLVLR